MNSRYFILLLCTSLILAGCSGWRLRGSESGLATLDRAIYLSGQSGQTYEYINQRLQRQNRVATLNSYDLNLIINSESFKRRTASLAGNAIAAEFELSLTVNYSIIDANGKKLRANQDVRIDRSYQFDQNDVAGKDREEALIQRDMIRNAGRQILQQLQFIQLN